MAPLQFAGYYGWGNRLGRVEIRPGVELLPF